MTTESGADTPARSKTSATAAAGQYDHGEDATEEAQRVGFADAEELREIALSQQQELQLLRREVGDLNLLIDTEQALLDSSHGADPFAPVLAALQPLFHFSHAVVLIESDEASPGLKCVAASHAHLLDGMWPRSRGAVRALEGRVVATVAESDTPPWRELSMRRGLDPRQPGLYLPVSTRDGRGFMLLLRPVGAEGFDRRDVRTGRKVSLLASQAFATRQANRAEAERERLDRLTDELRAARDSLARRANHDALTGLANREHFEDQVNGALTGRADSHLELAIAVIDLDGFKQVNDNFGHDAGDQLLVAVADRLRAHADAGDVIARISADEFMVLIDPLGPLDELMAALDRSLGDLREPFYVAGHRLMVSASIGLAVYPDHGTEFEELRRHADMAMYASKRSGRGAVTVFSHELSAAATDRINTEQQLRHAVAERRFRAVMQPEIDLRTMTVSGFEVLARQVDPDGTVGSSAAFIDVASQAGLLDDITDIVINDALAALPALDAAFGQAMTISINVSTTQVTGHSTLPALLARLQATGHPERFVIEVTEDALLEHDLFRTTVAPMLAEAGVMVSIDDFGTGYASMSRLLAVTADEVKIDRSFVTDIQRRQRSQVLAHTLGSLGRSFQAHVVAEGIETTDELTFLVHNGIADIGQGYLFSRPATPQDLIAGFDALNDTLSGLRHTSGAFT